MTTTITKTLSDALLNVRRDEKSGQEVLLIRSTKLKNVVASLKNELLFDRLVDIASVDYAGVKDLRFESNYFFYSTRYNKRLQLKMQLPDNDPPVLDSISDLFPLANTLEKNLFRKGKWDNIPFHKLTHFIERQGPAPLILTTGYCQAIEKLMTIDVPERAQLIRVVLCELERVLSHALWIGSRSAELGLPIVLTNALDLREHLAFFLEKYTGSRVGFSAVSIGGLTRDLPATFPDDVLSLVKKIRKTTRDLRILTEKNRLFMDRTRGEETRPRERAIEQGVTGPDLRASGLAQDLRKMETPSVYEILKFEVPMGTTGDLFDRVSVRFEEIGQSLSIIDQILSKFRRGPVMTGDARIAQPSDTSLTIENIEKGICPEAGEIYSRAEGANGEIGFFIVAEGTNKPRTFKTLTPEAGLPKSI